LTQEHIKAGLAAAKRWGKQGGRPQAISEEKLAVIRTALEAGASKAAIAGPLTSNAPRCMMYWCITPQPGRRHDGGASPPVLVTVCRRGTRQRLPPHQRRAWRKTYGEGKTSSEGESQPRGCMCVVRHSPARRLRDSDLPRQGAGHVPYRVSLSVPSRHVATGLSIGSAVPCLPSNKTFIPSISR